jgi:hypothetical protein
VIVHPELSGPFFTPWESKSHTSLLFERTDEYILRIKRKNTRDKMSALSSLSSGTARQQQQQQQNQFHRNRRPSGRIARAHAKRSVVVQNAKTSLSSPTSSASPSSSSSSSNEKEEELWLALG